MIELTWGDIKSPVFMGVLQRMIESKMPFDVTVKLLSLAKTINDEITLCNVTGEKVTKDHRSDPVQLNAEYGKLLSHKFQVKLNPIPSGRLTGIELSVNELLAIRPLLEDRDLYSDPSPTIDNQIDDKANSEIQEQPQAQI